MDNRRSWAALPRCALQSIAALLARPSQLMFARSLMSAGSEVLVAAAAAPALGDDDALVRLAEIVHQLARFGVVERGAHRNLQRDGTPVLPGAV